MGTSGDAGPDSLFGLCIHKCAFFCAIFFGIVDVFFSICKMLALRRERKTNFGSEMECNKK